MAKGISRLPEKCFVSVVPIIVLSNQGNTNITLLSSVLGRRTPLLFNLKGSPLRTKWAPPLNVSFVDFDKYSPGKECVPVAAIIYLHLILYSSSFMVSLSSTLYPLLSLFIFSTSK